MIVKTTASVCTAIHRCNHHDVTLADTDRQRIAAYTTNRTVHQAILKAFTSQSPRAHTIPANAYHPQIFIVVFSSTNLTQAKQQLARI